MPNFFQIFPKELVVFFLSMLPFTELRASIPLAIAAYGLSPIASFCWAVLGNFVPVILLVFLLEPISRFLSSHFESLARFFDWLFRRTRRQHSRKFELLEEFALIIFVAIPLPMTGGWSGSVAAFVFGIPPQKSLPLIAIGLLISGVLVTFSTLGVISLFSF